MSSKEALNESKDLSSPFTFPLIARLGRRARRGKEHGEPVAGHARSWRLDASRFLWIGVPDGAWNWDFLKVFLDEAKKRKMTVHAWFCVFPESSVLGQVRQHPDWLISSPKREIVRSVNPALPAVRRYEISLMLEVARKYDVDWIHLDYIRYPCEPAEPYFSFDPETLRLFKEDTEIDLAAVKARDSGNMAWDEWLRWNTDRVTVFVRELRAAPSSARGSASARPTIRTPPGACSSR